MSKFEKLMHLLDIEHPEIKDAEFPRGVRPLTDQQVAWIALNLPNTEKAPCARCAFCETVKTRGKVNELGIGGYMSNQEDGLKPAANNPKGGVTLRVPTTVIIASGYAMACKNREKDKEGFFLLSEKDQTCEHFREKAAPDKGTMKKKGE